MSRKNTHTILGLATMAFLTAAVAPAHAQTNSNNQNKQNNQPRTGYAPGAIPMPGVGVIPMPGLGSLTPRPGIVMAPGARVPTTPYSVPIAPLAGAFAPRSGMIAIAAPPLSVFPTPPVRGNYYRCNGVSYYYAPNGVWYGYPPAYSGVSVYYPGQTVVVSSPNYGYAYTSPNAVGTPITGPAGTITVQSNPYQSTVTLGGGTQISVFNGYAPTFVSGQTVYSPFGAYYGGPAYLQSTYVTSIGRPVIGWGVESGGIQVWADDDRYMSVNAVRATSLRTALNDLSRFWEDGNTAALRRHLDPNQSVAVFRGGRYEYALERSALQSLCEDTRSRINTVSFRFTNIQRREDGLVNAYAQHTFRPVGKYASPRTTTVRCTFAYRNGDWNLSALAFSPGTGDE